jgi:hypothetical protein
MGAHIRGAANSPRLLATPCARRAGPREHGRQAARSERDRPERAREAEYQSGHIHAAAGGVLIP